MVQPFTNCIEKGVEREKQLFLTQQWPAGDKNGPFGRSPWHEHAATSIIFDTTNDGSLDLLNGAAFH